MAARHRFENALQGGAEFGAIGAGVGSLVPGVGTGIGAAVGGGVGLLAGLLSSTEAQELAERMERGDIDPDQQEAIADALRRRFHSMRRQYGTDMARRGLTDSTIAARLQGGLYAAEGDALAREFAGISQRNKQVGRDMMAEQAESRAQSFGGAASVLGNLYLADRQTKMDAEWRDIYSAPRRPGMPSAPQAPSRPNATGSRPSRAPSNPPPVLNRGGNNGLSLGNRRPMSRG